MPEEGAIPNCAISMRASTARLTERMFSRLSTLAQVSEIISPSVSN